MSGHIVSVDEETSELVGAERYELTAGCEACHSGHYTCKLVTGVGEAEPSVPKLNVPSSRGP